MKEKVEKPIIPKTPRTRTVGEKATAWVGSPASLVAHTVFFVLSFVFVLMGVSLDTVLLVLTTAVSLEAIYLAIFIQMSVNRQALSLENVEEDIDEIQADVKEIGDDVEDLSEDVDEIAKDIDEISEDIDDISEDVDEISKDIDDIQEHDEKKEKVSLDNIENMLKKAIEDLERLKKQG